MANAEGTRSWATRTILIASILVAVAAPAALAHHSPHAARWYVGSYFPYDQPVIGKGDTGTIVCQSPPSPFGTPFGAGGACHLTSPRNEQMTVTVANDYLSPVGFWYEVTRYTGSTYHFCGVEGRAIGTVTLANPSGCVHVTIFPDAGQVSGTATVS